MRASQSIVIDDDPDHLIGLADTLNRHDIPCRQIRFNGEVDKLGPYPEVRFIFADLHLGAGAIGSDHMTDFSTIGSLLEDAIKPVGRYAILLWTMYPNQASRLQQFLAERLHGVPKPVDVSPLAKSDYVTVAGRVRDETKLINDIQEALDTLDILLDKPEPAEIKVTLTRLFDYPEVADREVRVPDLPGLHVRLDEWLGQELMDFGTTPRVMLENGDPDDLYSLERIVHAIATSRAPSHPHVVRDVVLQRIEKLYVQGISLAVIDGPELSSHDAIPPLEYWMNSTNALFGGITPRQFFEGEPVDVPRLQRISARLDAIDDGAFS